MPSRLAMIAALAFAIQCSACDAHQPDYDPTQPPEKMVIDATELLGDTSNLSDRVEHSTAVHFSWNRMAHVDWTTARQGETKVISRIVVYYPYHSANEEYSAKLLEVGKYGRSHTVSLQVVRKQWFGERGAVMALHAKGFVDVGMYRRWPI